MIEKVNPKHPDKVADRIAGALVDYAYTRVDNPKIAVDVLIGHGKCFITSETSVHIPRTDVQRIVKHVTKEDYTIYYNENMQDPILYRNQVGAIRCGDNGIFKGAPLTEEQKTLSKIAHDIYDKYDCDGKYILAGNELIVCQSNATKDELNEFLADIDYEKTINPLGYWTGGLTVDTGATNRKLGSDMADAVTGGGLHGKDLSKADVSINIYLFLEAQKYQKDVYLYCAIGDEYVDGKPYAEIVEIARNYIKSVGGFEKFAEWGLY